MKNPESKSTLFTLLLISFLILNGCEQPVQFGEPQPVGEKNLEAFPQKLRGQFLDETDSSVLTITDKIMMQHYHSLLKTARQDLDTLYQLVGDSMIINRETQQQTRVAIINDTIAGYIDIDATRFNISAKNVLREFKGYYFLNTAYSESWEVQMLDLDHRHLTIGKIPSKEGFEKLKNISATSVDSASGNVSLNKEEFKDFVKQGGFYITDEFVRIK